MIRTMIVDDDFLVRSYLKQMNAWERAGYEVVADLRDGEEALKAVEEECPDVIVTDLSMPLMDGIELIRRVRKEYRSVYIIVLSCHDDFEYVKEAMRLGADEYVLKNSLDEDSLYEVLKNAKHQMEGREEKSKEEDETKKLIEIGRHSLKYHFFNGLLAGSFTMKEREEKRQEAGIKGKFINSAVINMFIPEWNVLRTRIPDLELEQYNQRFLQKLVREIKENEEENGYVECVCLGEGVFCCFLDLSEMRRTSLMKQRLTSLATTCFHCCKNEQYTYEAGVSSICFGEEGIRQAYQQAREMMKLSFYQDSGILYYEGQPAVERELPKEALDFLKEASGYVQHRDFQGMKKEFSKAVESFRQHHVDSRIVLHWLKELDQKLHIERSPEQYAMIYKAEHLSAVCEEYGQKLFMQKKMEIPKGVNPAVRMVVNFLHEHYREQIGLTEAAEAAGLNTAYLSYLFKQEMGTGFSGYLLELRMECAKNLLKTTNEKVKDVALKSGFNDYHYFSKAFKKMNGLSPADYRKQEGET